MRTDFDNYFNWVARTIMKFFIVLLTFEGQKNIKDKPEIAIERLKMVAILFNGYVKKEEEKMLHINVIVWINELVDANPALKTQLEEILEFIDKDTYSTQYQEIEYRNEVKYMIIQT